MTEAAAQRIVLASRPNGPPTAENFRLETIALPTLPPGGLLLRVLYLSLDPYMRGRMDDRKSYAKPVGIGEVMTGEAVCEVMASDRAGYAKGDVVLGAHRLVHERGVEWRRSAQARSEGRADHHGARRARHARLHGLFRAARDR